MEQKTSQPCPFPQQKKNKVDHSRIDIRLKVNVKLGLIGYVHESPSFKGATKLVIRTKTIKQINKNSEK